MKVEMAAVLAGLLACTAATLEELFPFHEVLHTWWAALLAGLIAAGLVAVVVTGAVRGGRARLASIAALGGAVLAGGIVLAAMVGGAPQRVPAVPGQTYRAAHGGSVAVVFPLIDPADPPARWPSSVIVDDGRRAWSVKPGTAARAGAFVFSVAAGPIAFVDATTPNGEPVTVTQPDGAAFLSPYLTFTGMDGAQPEDYFAVPALHRDVQVDYWPGLPSRGIDIPFLAIRISAQNGGSLYEGAAISGRTITKAGVSLRFVIGTYPVVDAATAPPMTAYAAGMALLALGIGVLAVDATLHARARPVAERRRG